MRRALPVLLVVLAVAGCPALALAGCGTSETSGTSGVPHRAWVTQVCEALSPWRAQLTALNGTAAEQMKTATTPAQARTHLLGLLDGARQASEQARTKVAGAGVPDVADGAAIERRFVAALAAVRDAYTKAQHTVQDLPESGFYPGVAGAMDTLNQEYARAGVDAAKLASVDLRKDFDEVPACG